MNYDELKLPAAALREAKKLSRAKKMLADARHALARVTRPGHSSPVVDPAWSWAAELIEKRRAKLLAIPGVIGLGLGFRLRGGAPTGEPCLTVYVRRKLPPNQLAAAGIPRLPKHVSSGKRRLPVDVIALGRIRRQVDAGDSLGAVGAGRRGTLGALAEDLDHNDTVALTAMHVTTLGAFPRGSAVAPRFISPMPGGALFARLREGTRSGIDAAKLALDAQQPAITELPAIGTIRGWRPVTFPGDQGTTVRMVGAVSGIQSGFIVNPIASLPEAGLDAAILVNISTQRGDSGAAIVDHERLLLGFLVGSGGPEQRNLRVFTPASLVFARLRCDIPTV